MKIIGELTMKGEIFSSDLIRALTSHYKIKNPWSNSPGIF
jgi:hypothetical protein